MDATRLQPRDPTQPASAGPLAPTPVVNSTASFRPTAPSLAQGHSAQSGHAAVPTHLAHLGFASPDDDPLELPTPPAHFLQLAAAQSQPQAQLQPPRPDPDGPAAQISLLGTLNADADTALIANHAYQRALVAAMARIEHARERTAVIKTIVASLAKDLAAPATTANGSTHELRVHAPGVVEPQLPYFWAMYGKDLPPSEDAKARERYLMAVHARPWHAAERKKLKQEVVAQNHRLVAREALLRGEDPAALLAARKARDPAWFVENTDGLDWDTLALVFDHRTPKACKIQWLEREHPRVNRVKKWGAAERARLEALVAEHRADEEGDWVAVAAALGTGRTAAACAQQWQKRPAPRTSWSKEEDDRLKAAVQQWGENWDVVARETGRAAHQCLHRYLHSLYPGVARGRFTADEDAKIVAAVAAFGTRNWSAVAARVGGRTELQCRERWNKCLNPEVVAKASRDWTAEDDALLLRLRDDDRLGWAEISQRGFNKERTAATIAKRYEALKSQSGSEAGKVGAGKGRKRRKGM